MKMASKWLPPGLGWVVMVALLLGVGCSSHTATTTGSEAATVKLQRLVNLYNQYTGSHNGMPPPDEMTLQAFFKEQQIPDDALISPRDNQPFAIKYNVSSQLTPKPGQPLLPPGAAAKVVLVYEKTGVSGKRLVAYQTGQVEEVDASRQLD